MCLDGDKFEAEEAPVIRGWPIVGALVCILLSSASDASGRTWHVRLDGTGDSADIQPAVDAAAAGDSILIGPGRFQTFHQCIAPAWVENVIIWVTKDDLTFVGSGQDETILGPVSFYGPEGRHPKGVCAFGNLSGRFSDLAIENIETGVMWEHGRLEIQLCTFSGYGTQYLALDLIVDEGMVSQCIFNHLPGGTAIAILPVYGNLQALVVEGCTISGAEYGISVGYGAQNVRIQDCELNVTYWGMSFDAGSMATVSRCHVAGAQDRSVAVTNGSTIAIVDSSVDGSRFGLSASGGGSIVGSGNVISNTTEAAVLMSSRAQISLHGCDLLPGAGFGVYCGPSSGSATYDVDMSGNYWGTASATEIANLIYDRHDSSTNLYTISYEPFANQPLPEESTNWGSLKALFR